MNKTIIALDPGTKCGYAVRQKNGIIVSGVFDLSLKRHESPGMKFIKLCSLLREVIKSQDDPIVVYEEVRRHLGVSAAHIYGGITSMIQVVCVEEDCEHFAIPVGTVKKFATGKGNAGKDDMIAACVKKWGYTPIDDNEADARWIAETAASQF